MNTRIITADPQACFVWQNDGFIVAPDLLLSTCNESSNLDLLLLSALEGHRSLVSAVEVVVQMCPDFLGRHCKPSLIEARFEKLLELGILKDAMGELQGPERDPEVGLKVSDIEATDPGAPFDRRVVYRLSNNFRLVPEGNEFKIWSPRARKYLFLDLRQSILLISYGMGLSSNKVFSQCKFLGSTDELSKTVEGMAAAGILVSVHSQASRLKAKKDSGGKNKAIGQKKGSTRKQFQQAKPEKVGGRVPVYFVPHMLNHYPLALGMMYSQVMAHRDGALLEKYLLVPITGGDQKQLVEKSYRKYGPGIWLFSNYIWCVDLNLQIAALVKSHSGANLTIHGGPSTPSYRDACADFMKKNPSVDIAVHGEGEATIVDILETLDSSLVLNTKLSAVPGITFRLSGSQSHFVRTEDRNRIVDIDSIPSPYLTGVFDQYSGQIEAAIIESNRGCPYGCTFCDWGSATNQKIRKFDLDRVRNEVEWIAQRQVRVLWIADANYGIYDRDVELAEWICEMKKNYGYPKEVVVNYAKNATKRLAKIVDLFANNGICNQGIISIQTRDEATLEVIDRKNIKSQRYGELSDIFSELSLPLSTDLMIGLPGITRESFKHDLQYYFDTDVEVKAYPTQLLPNSPMADPEYIEKYKIEIDAGNYLVSTFSYSEADLRQMMALYSAYNIGENFSTLRYVLRYVQWERGIKALDYLEQLLATVNKNPLQYPSIHYALNRFAATRSLPGGWNQFYREVSDFSLQSFSVERSPAFAAILAFNEAVMPDDGAVYPLEVHLDHDVVSYVKDWIKCSGQQNRQESLSSYPPAETVVEDKYEMSRLTHSAQQYDSHQTFWELFSPLSRSQSEPNFR